MEDVTLHPQQIHTGPLHVLGTVSPMWDSGDVSLNPAQLRAAGARTANSEETAAVEVETTRPGPWEAFSNSNAQALE